MSNPYLSNTYSGKDSYAGLLLYCERALATLNAGAQVELERDASGKIKGAASHIHLQVGDEVLEVKGEGVLLHAVLRGGERVLLACMAAAGIACCGSKPKGVRPRHSLMRMRVLLLS